VLKKIDSHSMVVRKTVDGKFKDPEWKAVYCPKEAQQMYRDATAENRAKSEQEKAAAKRLGNRAMASTQARVRILMIAV
jgi:hypothetical protein